MGLLYNCSITSPITGDPRFRVVEGLQGELSQLFSEGRWAGRTTLRVFMGPRKALRGLSRVSKRANSYNDNNEY